MYKLSHFKYKFGNFYFLVQNINDALPYLLSNTKKTESAVCMTAQLIALISVFKRVCLLQLRWLTLSNIMFITCGSFDYMKVKK